MSQGHDWVVSCAGIECHRCLWQGILHHRLLPSPWPLALMSSPGKTKPLMSDFPHRFIHSSLSTHQSGCAWGIGKELCQVTYSLGSVLHITSFSSCKFRLRLNKFLFVAVEPQCIKLGPSALCAARIHLPAAA